MTFRVVQQIGRGDNMKILGDNSAKLEILRKSPTSELFVFNFSCSWCTGSFELYSEAENYKKLQTACRKIAEGKRVSTWLSEKGDLELKFSRSLLGKIRTIVICNPSVTPDFPGKLEFEVELDLASFDQALLPLS